MPSVIVVGCQWGDEGKGKIVDYLSAQADYVVRYQGGSNAGHTIRVGDQTYRLRLLPSGVIHRKKVVIANGVVVDPEVLLKEISDLKSKGFNPDLSLSDRAHITLSYHLLLDAAEEEFKGSLRSGTTMRGIGPTYTDKAARYGIRTSDLLDPEILGQKISQNAILKQKVLSQVYGSSAQISKDDLLVTCKKYGDELRKYIVDTSIVINGALDAGKRVLFEGAQGLLLDVDHGVYPFGTSSNTAAGAACTGAGVGPTRIDEIIGVVKAYTSRVGAGPLPTELTDDTGSRLQEKGKEFGTVTGRRRRCGWLDAVALRYASRVNGLTGIALTKLDTLAGFNPVKICMEYKADGQRISDQPSSVRVYSKCVPFYEEMKGWPDLSESEWATIAKKGYDALPKEAKDYVAKIETIAKVPVKIVSIGEMRDATINRLGVWKTSFKI
ncbi:MAG: adenylosuccinate synthase [Candidatus Bathyarchaeia archaeon]|jgi:adenylosuccinate synthase